jgi:hypothetical protein
MIILFDEAAHPDAMDANSRLSGRRIGLLPKGNGKGNPAQKQKTEAVKQ